MVYVADAPYQARGGGSRVLDSSLTAPIISGAGVCGIFCVLFILGWIYPRRVLEDKDRQIAALEERNRVDRERADTAAAGLAAASEVIGALRDGLRAAVSAQASASAQALGNRRSAGYLEEAGPPG